MEISNGVKKIFLGFFIIVLFLAVFNNVLAAGLVPCGRTDPEATAEERKPCTFCDLFVLLQRIFNFLLFQIVPPLAILMIAIGGGMYIFAPLSSPEALAGGAKGGPKMLSQAKKLLTSVVFGLLIIYGAWILVNTFFMLIGINEVHFKGLPQNWFRINCSIQSSSSSTSAPAPTPTSTSVPASTTTTSSSQISNCNACPGNEMGLCDRGVCENTPVSLGCKYISVSLPGGGQGGMCVGMGQCGMCGTVSRNCNLNECSAIGGSCRFILDPVGGGRGLCILPNECEKCGDLVGGCTQQLCSSIGPNCRFISGIPPIQGSCVNR